MLHKEKAGLCKPTSQLSTVINSVKCMPTFPTQEQMEIEFVSVCLCFLVFLLCISSWSFFLNETSKPKLAIYHWPLVGGLPSLLLNAHRIPEWLTEVFLSLGNGCGSVSFEGPVFSNLRYFATCHPQNIEYILKTNFSNFPKGPDFREIFDILGKGIFADDGDSWRLQRRLIHTLFASVTFRSGFSGKIRNEVQGQLVPFLAHVARQGSVIDLQDICTRLAFDCTMSTLCGKEERCLSVDLPRNEVAEAIAIVQDTVMYRHAIPKFCWKLFRFVNVGKERDFANAWKKIDCFLGEFISRTRQRLSEGELNGTELLSMTLKSSDASSMDDKFLRDVLLSLFLGGKDTIASGLVWFFWMVAKTPHVEKKIVDELKMVASQKISEDSEGVMRVFDFDELKGIVYLHAAICEALRLCPPVPLNRKCVLKEDVLPDGSVVKPGTQIIIPFFSEGKMPWIWGEDSMEFKPERWIDDDGNLSRELLSNFFAFNAGPRSCLGKDISFIQMKVCVAAVLFNFHVELLEGQEICTKPSIVLQMTNGLLVRIKEREAW